MKGFPNQIAELGKLAAGIRCLISLVDGGNNGRDDGIFGQALVRAGVAGTGHRPLPADEYIHQQLTKASSNQSFRTTARGLRELYRLLGLIDDSGAEIRVTNVGRHAASFAHSPMNDGQRNFWRKVIRNMTHGSDRQISHPYQVLLKLVGQRPGITRAKCALALEARDDSVEELMRISSLADLSEEEIRSRIDVTKPNWDNAKKVLPAFAEQLHDVIREGQSFVLADAPGQADAGTLTTETQVGVRAPRTSRSVTSASIGRISTDETFDDVEIPETDSRLAREAAIRLRSERRRRHNMIVQDLATRFTNARLFEDPFDILALIATQGFLIEVKTLDGTTADERERVRDALGQLLYYEAFLTVPVASNVVHKIACFEHKISVAHQSLLNHSMIGAIWKVEGGYVGDALATSTLSGSLRMR